MVEVLPIRRLLIANRGEIAVRVARTAHRIGIETVGVYSEPDAGALHVDVVDAAVSLGGSSPADSYLRIEAVMEAARRTGCDAVHPGYGFLAENAEFARRVVEAGLIWVGPAPEQISLLGDKVAAKRTALEAGVSTTPLAEVMAGAVSGDVTFPAVVKAAAGGGGRGMRIVRDRGGLEEAIAAAGREAEAAFGDGTVFVEPYIERARHVEVQIIGDRHGAIVHLGERECSIQRRSQKIVEEAPSAGISAATRLALWEGAVALGKHVGYQNAGTVEFLVGDDGSISFLEVNTRLQVEHPVTEAVTGLDLVELQLLCASGEPLPFTQDDVAFSGHAIEARVVAEDPAANWLPSTGRISVFHVDEGVRVDSGVRAGTEITPDYDSLLAKLIALAPNRTEAARRLRKSLRTSCIAGVATNVDALVAILSEPDFLRAATTTHYLEDHAEVAVASGPAANDLTALLLGAVFAQQRIDRAANTATGFAPPGWRNLRTTGQRSSWLRRGVEHHVEVEPDGETAAIVLLGPWPHPGDDGSLPADTRRRVGVRLLESSDDRQVLEVDGVRHVVTTVVQPGAVVTYGPGGMATWSRHPRFVLHAADEAGSGARSPLPGTVIAVHVAPGDHVAAGDPLMVVEAMKMEHKVAATTPALVAEVMFAVGDRVDAGDLLVRLAPVEPE